jgi:hypothetical protein
MEADAAGGGGDATRSPLVRLPAALIQRIHDIVEADYDSRRDYAPPLKSLLRLCCRGIKATVDGLGWARLKARCAHGRRSRS